MLILRKGQLLVKLGHYHAEPHEAEATPEANNVRTETPYPYLPPKVELVISPPTAGSGGPLPPPSGAPFGGAGRRRPEGAGITISRVPPDQRGES